MTQIKIILNGEETVLASQMTVAQLIAHYQLDVKKIAIEKDLEIVNPDDFTKTILLDGSRVEIVHFIGGG